MISSGNGQVWLVDDEKELANAYRDFMESRLSVRVFYSAREAMACFDEENVPPDVLVTDLKMDDFDGLGLIRAFRSRSSDTEVILISGGAERSDLVSALDQRVGGFLEKPINPKVLEDKILESIQWKKKSGTPRASMIDIVMAQEERFLSIQRLSEIYLRRAQFVEERMYGEKREPYESREDVLRYAQWIRDEEVYVKAIESLTLQLDRISRDD
jgi:DNA-binding NtrC family response regulator